jgi:DNA-binding beta-propeller fold protein YncE
MVGPVSIQVNPIDGKHVYVACRHSRSIIAFDRDPQSGILVHNAKASYLTPWSLMALNDSYPAGDGYQNAAAWGYPLHGVQSILMSPEQDHLYAVSSFDNALAIFNRDNVTGELTLGSVIQNGIRTGGRTVYGLSGAYGISMSIDGKSIYVSSAKDNANGKRKVGVLLR